ncbi:MAG: hypothetical protein R6U65_08290 [Perlabentimonas sp.]
MSNKKGKKPRLKKKDRRRRKQEESQEVGVFVGHKKIKPKYEGHNNSRECDLQ